VSGTQPQLPEPIFEGTKPVAVALVHRLEVVLLVEDASLE
jgi:hypothetical protein